MSTKDKRSFWARLLVIVGGIAMLVGAADPLEGSVVIVIGAGLVTLGRFLAKERGHLIYWLWIFGSIAASVAAMFILSAFGGIGGSKGHSAWWGLLLVPYPIAWVMGVVNLGFGAVRQFRRRPAVQPAG
jgi:hypothetical protein